MAETTIGGKIEHFTADNVSWTPVTLSAYCHRVIFGEDASVAGWPTQMYKVRKPQSASGDALTKPDGTTYETENQLMGPGTIIAFVQTTVGSTTFFLDQQQRRRWA